MRPGYKQTEVGEIPEDWNVARLDDVAVIDPDNLGANTEPDYAFNYISLECVDRGRLQGFTNEIFRSAPSRARRRLRRGDVLVSTVRPNLKSHLLFNVEQGSWICSTGFAVVRCRDTAAVPAFVFAHLFAPAISNQIESLLTGSNYPAINGKDVKALRLPIPPTRAEQRAIAGALSDVDALIGALDQLIAKKRDLKQAAMQQLLTGKKRLPGFRGEWAMKRLGDLAHIQRGASPRPIESPVWFDDRSSIGWVRISDVTRSGMFLRETTQRLSTLGVQHSRPVAKGNLIMSICATVGRPVITDIDVCIHDGFVVFGNLQAEMLFVYYVLKGLEPNWSKFGQTGSQMNLNTGLITATRIFLPPPVEQAAIAEVLSDMDAELAALTQRRDKTRALKQGMMQELLTGRTRLV